MAQTAYRDGAQHDLEALEAEQARLLEEDEIASGGTAELSEELATLRLRVRAPVKSSVDVRERRHVLRRYDVALEAARIARSQRSRRRRVRAVLLSMGAVVVVSGVTSIAFATTGARGSCHTSTACRERGRCAESLTTVLGITTPHDPSGCVARKPSHCDEPCRESGRCEISGGQCVAQSDDDCANSETCRWNGHCAAHDGVCVASTDAHCEASVVCAKHGECTQLWRTCVE